MGVSDSVAEGRAAGDAWWAVVGGACRISCWCGDDEAADRSAPSPSLSPTLCQAPAARHLAGLQGQVAVGTSSTWRQLSRTLSHVALRPEQA